jgi:hypothetical protein
MPKVRSILLTLEVRPAGRRCTCKRSKQHELVKGDPRFVIKQPGIATSEDGYCTACALAMIAAARTTLDDLERDLRSGRLS